MEFDNRSLTKLDIQANITIRNTIRVQTIDPNFLTKYI